MMMTNPADEQDKLIAALTEHFRKSIETAPPGVTHVTRIAVLMLCGIAELAGHADEGNEAAAEYLDMLECLLQGEPENAQETLH